MASNPHYWRKRGNITEATAQIIHDSATALKVFESGGIQMMQDFSPNDLKQVKAMPEYKTYPYLKTNYLAFRVKGSEAENRFLRLAIAHAIDRKPIPKILNGTQKVASSMIPPRVVGYNSKLSVPLDVAKAKDYLKKSGFDVKKPLVLVSRNPERPRILCQYIQSELKKNLGLDVQIQLFDHKMFRSQLVTQNYPMMLMVWAADYPDGDTFMGLFESNTGNNMTRVSIPKVDENISKARLEWNTLKREKLYREALNILQVQEAVVVPLYYEENEVLVKKNVKGLQLNPIGYFFLKDVTL
jgi:ABC-type oligopeptide transport system substrate-binding subunit